jgi:hypothetical protein
MTNSEHPDYAPQAYSRSLLENLLAYDQGLLSFWQEELEMTTCGVVPAGIRLQGKSPTEILTIIEDIEEQIGDINAQISALLSVSLSAENLRPDSELPTWAE